MTTQPSCEDMEHAKQLIGSSAVILLMKGTPSKPKCKFSKRMISLLVEQGLEFSHFNVLDVKDQPLYSALKHVGNFPTFPQLYISGSLVGGIDIVSEMIETGELKEEVLRQSPESITRDVVNISNDQTQLNMRFEDGKIIQVVFSHDTTLSKVYEFVSDKRDSLYSIENVGTDPASPVNCSKPFTLVKPHPLEEFNQRPHLFMSLKQLGLVPKSALLIVNSNVEQEKVQVDNKLKTHHKYSLLKRYAITLGLGIVAVLAAKLIYNKD
ncbi:monothiol glutaredoxin-4 [Acrasis kona]|uniref:Monothiol glutaredoxin-4 n=1 Tax=Acrasis kona TaxID=1008807 RepID=A0AAW2Z6D9_9EUKA